MAIGFDFVQVISITAAFQLDWPAGLQSVFNGLSSLNFNVQLVAPECTVGASYWDKWWVVMTLPEIMMGVFVGTFFCMKAFQYIYPKATKSK
jgi:hypothetical protein